VSVCHLTSCMHTAPIEARRADVHMYVRAGPRTYNTCVSSSICILLLVRSRQGPRSSTLSPPSQQITVCTLSWQPVQFRPRSSAGRSGTAPPRPAIGRRRRGPSCCAPGRRLPPTLLHVIVILYSTALITTTTPIPCGLSKPYIFVSSGFQILHGGKVQLKWSTPAVSSFAYIIYGMLHSYQVLFFSSNLMNQLQNGQRRSLL
jgi:hypothetical protein